MYVVLFSKVSKSIKTSMASKVYSRWHSMKAFANAWK